MNKRAAYSIIAVLGMFLLFMLPARAFASELIKDFNVDMEVYADSTFSIQETIIYDFADTEHHGIERIIPFSYERSGFSYKIKLSVRKVTDENGKALDYQTNAGLGSLTIRIGDPDVYVTG